MNRLKYYLNKPKDFRVVKHSEKNLYLIKYLHPDIYWGNEFAIESRGIVLNGDGEFVSRPYKKFFNYLEFKSRDDLPEKIKEMSYWENNKSFVVYEKLDGSLAVISQYEGELVYSSSGSLEGKYPNKFKNWIERTLTEKQMENLKEFTKIYTFIFEYISPKNRIVVPYKEEKMILHGVIHTRHGWEVGEETSNSLANSIGVEMVKKFDLNLEELKDIQGQQFGDNVIEGFVIKFENNKRLKIKTEEYMGMHRVSALGFGELYTKNNILMIINQLDNDTLDDTISFYEQREDLGVLEFIYKVKSYYNLFCITDNRAKEIYLKKDFSPKWYAMNIGTSSNLDKLVLNSDRNEDKRKRIRNKYILTKLLKEEHK